MYDHPVTRVDWIARVLHELRLVGNAALILLSRPRRNRGVATSRVGHCNKLLVSQENYSLPGFPEQQFLAAPPIRNPQQPGANALEFGVPLCLTTHDDDH